MGRARETMDALTQAVLKGDMDTLETLFADGAQMETPDQGTLIGAQRAAEYMGRWVAAFPDAEFEYAHTYETGDTAIDEGYFCGTHTQPLSLPDGSTLRPTHLRVRLRSCDLLTVDEAGKISSYRLYFNDADLAEQLGVQVAP